jgi:hypothetical protein
MRKVLFGTVLALAASATFAQSSANTNSSAQTSSMGIGGGAAQAGLSSDIRSIAGGGAGGTAQANGGDPTAAVILNMGSDGTQGAANAQQGSGGGTTTTNVNSKVKTVGTPGSMSLGISFSQYNCANSAGGGVGFMGGVVQIGGGMESDPCNARANASAFYQIAQTLATSNPDLAKQLYHAAILLIGNSTKSTKEALQMAGVPDWAVGTGNSAPAAPPTEAPAPVGNTRYPPAPPAAVAPSSPVAVAASTAEPVFGERIVTPPIPDTTLVVPSGESTLVADPIQFTTKISALK